MKTRDILSATNKGLPGDVGRNPATAATATVSPEPDKPAPRPASLSGFGTYMYAAPSLLRGFIIYTLQLPLGQTAGPGRHDLRFASSCSFAGPVVATPLVPRIRLVRLSGATGPTGGLEEPSLFAPRRPGL